MLDTITLLAAISMVDIFLAILVLLVWWGDCRYAGMRQIKIGMSLFAAAAVVSALRNVLPEALCIGLGNAGLMAGGTILMNGILMLADKRPIWRWHLTAMVVIGISFLYYLIAVPSTPVRNGLGAFWAAFLCITTFGALRRGTNLRGSHMTRWTFAALLIEHSLAEVGRGAMTPFIDPRIDFERPSPVLTVSCFELIFFSIALTIYILHLVNERLRDELKESEDRITSAFQVANDAFALFDRQDRFLTANQRFRELFPTAVEQLQPGKMILDLFGSHSEQFGLERSWLERKRVDWHNIEHWDRVACLPHGQWLHVSGKIAQDGGLVLCWSDITAFKQAEEILAQELSRERELATVQRNFVSMASHQFRTPLAIIDLNAQLLAPSGKLAAPQSEVPERAASIRRTVRRMIGLIETMLFAASAEAGTIKLKRSPVDPAVLLREACERVREITPNRIITCDIDHLPDRVLCDFMMVDQVILNILSNAVKYSAESTPIIVKARTDGKFVAIDVIDRGVGIAAQDLPHVFDRFFRADNVDHVAGTGIGLTLTRHIVELHGGTISVDSQLGVGSTFTVRFPIG